MKTLQIHSQIGNDGVLNVQIPFGLEAAASRVVITVKPEEDRVAAERETEWHQFVNETYGSCAGLGLEERPEQLPLEERDVIE